MSLTIQSVAAYLGRPASTMLSDAPFKYWEVNRTVDSDLDEPVIDYVFPKHSLDFVCDNSDTVSTVFFYYDGARPFDENIVDLPFFSNRQTVIDILGESTKRGGGLIDPVLGDFGPWERFPRKGYVIHVEYRVGIDRINKVTLMRDDVVPN